jgi:hypothetical protein
MIRRVLTFALAVLALAGLMSAEPTFISVSATQTVQSVSLPRGTQEVTVISDGASSTCYFRLFTDADTPGAATASSIQVKSGEGVGLTFMPAISSSGGYPAGVSSSESFGASGKRATYYKSMSVICASGQTATWRVIAK